MPDDAEPDIRVAVPKHLEKELRLYRRLWLAEQDLLEAKAALDEILKARIPIPRNDLPPPLLLSLTTALVVAYARPWVPSRGESIADRVLPGSLLRKLTSRQRELHDYLIGLRNKHVAHADADVIDLHLRLYPGGHSAILRHFREPFRRVELVQVRRAIEKLERAVEAKCIELRYVLPNGQWL
jgi:hypothetical protein